MNLKIQRQVFWGLISLAVQRFRVSKRLLYSSLEFHHHNYSNSGHPVLTVTPKAASHFLEISFKKERGKIPVYFSAHVSLFRTNSCAHTETITNTRSWINHEYIIWINHIKSYHNSSPGDKGFTFLLSISLLYTWIKATEY